MFSVFFQQIVESQPLNINRLRKCFDLAMTKKLAVIKLPPSFWMQDPKINPRADHLFWAALLLDDRQRAGLALSAMAVEHEERYRKKTVCRQTDFSRRVDESLRLFLLKIPEEDEQLRVRIRLLAEQIKP